MKTTLVRLSVLALTFTGFTASSVVSYSQKSQINVTQTKKNTVPVPMCLPNDPTCCGLR